MSKKTLKTPVIETGRNIDGILFKKIKTKNKQLQILSKV